MVSNMSIFSRRQVLTGGKYILCAVLAGFVASCGGFSAGAPTAAPAGKSSYAALDMATADTDPVEDEFSEESSMATVVIVARRPLSQDGAYHLSSR
jgi:hypothetical protein